MTTLASLTTAGPIILDGAMGTLLQDAGLDDGGSPELWNVEHPDRIAAIHTAYLDAGSQVITTNTFGGTRPRLAMHDLADRVIELNRAAAQVARRAVQEFNARTGANALVAGDIGPSGELLEPMGEATPESLQEIFAEQLTGLIEGGIDLVLVETMSDLAEVAAAVRAAQQVAPGVPILASLSFDTKLRTMMGVTPAAAVEHLAALGVTAVGANCGRGPEEMRQIAEQLVAARPDGLLIAAQSNAGLPVLRGDVFVYEAPPAELAAHAVELRDLGVDLIGACCGSTPAHLAAIRAAVTES